MMMITMTMMMNIPDPTNNWILSRRRKEVRACRQIRKGDEVGQISMHCNGRNPHSLYFHAEKSPLIACISMLKGPIWLHAKKSSFSMLTDFFLVHSTRRSLLDKVGLSGSEDCYILKQRFAPKHKFCSFLTLFKKPFEHGFDPPPFWTMLKSARLVFWAPLSRWLFLSTTQQRSTKEWFFLWLGSFDYHRKPRC